MIRLVKLLHNQPEMSLEPDIIQVEFMDYTMIPVVFWHGVFHVHSFKV